jgi:hypothetical protein
MIKKMLVSVIAAGALCVPLAGVALADPTPDNPGVAGTSGGPPGGAPPGSSISPAAKVPGFSTPDVYGGPPGQAVKEDTPGCNPDAKMCGKS